MTSNAYYAVNDKTNLKPMRNTKFGQVSSQQKSNFRLSVRIFFLLYNKRGKKTQVLYHFNQFGRHGSQAQWISYMAEIRALSRVTGGVAGSARL